jgi:coenzyme F420 biosynthesis associated uncharacterized protein
MTEPVSWATAQKVAAQVSRRGGSLDPRDRRQLERDFAEFTEQAEELVGKATGLRPPSPARGRVTDREGWVTANVASFRRLMAPLTAKLSERGLPGPLAQVTGVLTGAQIGMVLGWMSGRVLGQYDLLIAEGENDEEQDLVYYVGPNVISLERRHGFAPNEFRLWIALHEVTHRAQFTAVPWLRSHFLGLVERGLDMAAPDPHHMLEALKRASSEIRAGRNPLAEAGLVGMIADEEQLATLHQVQALMSLLEGHGDVTMDRAGEGLVPGAARFAKVLRERRAEARGVSRLLQQLIGLEAKMRQYAEGERFVEQVERAGGPSLLSRVWQGASMLPTLEEIRSPERWVARAGDGVIPAVSGV